MERQQFWETLKHKYEEKNRILQQREEELRLKLDVYDTVVRDGGPKTQEIKQVPSFQKSGDESIRRSINKVLQTVASQKTNEEITVSSIPNNVENIVTHIDFKSCACPPTSPPSEKPGLFNCIWSIFGSTKAKPPSPETSSPSSDGVSSVAQDTPAPQDVPTKEIVGQSDNAQLADGPTNVVYNLSKNENCMCNPCTLDFFQQDPGQTSANITQKSSQDSSRQRNENVCNCSICTGGSLPPSLTQHPAGVSQRPTRESKQESDYTCKCSVCTLNTPPVQKPASILGKLHQDSICQGNGDTCNCSICTNQCPNDYTLQQFATNDDYQRVFGQQNAQAFTSSSFTDDNCPQVLKPNAVVETNNFFSPSKLSFKSLDLFYMKNIYELANEEKDILKKIQILEKKEKIYEDVLKEYKNVDFSSKGRDDFRCGPYPRSDATTPQCSEAKNNAELKLENFLLRNELKDIKLEIRQYIERMEGPMQFKIESEKYKCQQLEQKLEDAAREAIELQEFYQKEINALKLQLCTATTNVYNLTTQNAQMKEEIQFFQEKCAKLEEDLIRQKISEAETIKSLQAALNAQIQANVVVKEECDLHQIARELSKLLKECEPCGDCLTLPEDLTATAMLLKSLTDMVDKKLHYAEDVSSKITDVKGLTRTSETEAPAETTESEEPIKAAVQEQFIETTESEASTEVGDSKAPTEVIESLGIVVTQELKGLSQTLGLNMMVSEPQYSGINDSSADQQQTEGQPAQGDTVSEKSIATSEAKKTSKTKSIDSEANRQMDRASRLSEIKQEAVESKINENSRISVNKTQVSDRQSTIDEKSDRSTRKSQVDEKFESSSKRSATDETSEKGRRISIVNETSERCSQRSRDIEPVSKPKTSCKCIKSKKPIPPVDQIWPKADRPPVMKESSVLETTAVSTKQKCDCIVARKLKEQAQAQISAARSSKKPCKCSKRASEGSEEPKSRTSQLATVDQLRGKSSERFKLTHQVTASKSKELLKSETSVKCLKVKENFPFDIDTQVDVINKPPDGVHVTTTITKSGMLEVITEGPEGVIETTLIYTNSGNIEVVTEILEFQGRGKACKRGKGQLPDLGIQEVKAIEAPKVEEVPEEVSKVGQNEPINPNCLCRECPNLKPVETKPEGMSSFEESETIPSEPEKTPSIAPNCDCQNCPKLKKDKKGEIEVGANEILELDEIAQNEKTATEELRTEQVSEPQEVSETEEVSEHKTNEPLIAEEIIKQQSETDVNVENAEENTTLEATQPLIDETLEMARTASLNVENENNLSVNNNDDQQV